MVVVVSKHARHHFDGRRTRQGLGRRIWCSPVSRKCRQDGGAGHGEPGNEMPPQVCLDTRCTKNVISRSRAGTVEVGGTVTRKTVISTEIRCCTCFLSCVYLAYEHTCVLIPEQSMSVSSAVPETRQERPDMT